MFLAFQIPVLDCRDFVGADTRHLPNPTWPLPVAGREFVRSFGQVRERPRGGIERWAGESDFCRAARGVRFLLPLQKQGPVIHGGNSSLKCVFRRLYADGRAVVRFEVGLRTGSSLTEDQVLDRSEIWPFLRAVLGLKVRIPVVGANGKKETVCLLVNAGEAVAEHFRCSTTKLTKGKLPPSEKWWVQAGDPLLFVEHREGELTAVPRESREIPIHQDARLRVAYARLLSGGRSLGVWFLGVSSGADTDVRRRLRIHLFRLHAERECIRRLFHCVIQKKLVVERGTAASERLQAYLNESNRLLTRRKSEGFMQEDLLHTIQTYGELVTPGEREDLLAALEAIRLNVFRGVARLTEPQWIGASPIVVMGEGNNIQVGTTQHIGGKTVNTFNIQIGENAVVHGDFVIAQTIQSSFNKVQESGASQEIKTQLEALHKAVAEMTKHMPPEKGREAARDLQSLSEEVSAPAPRKKWYDVSAEGLLEAAKAVGAAAMPVVDSVKAILTLLA